MTEGQPRSIEEITADLERAQTASAQVYDEVESRRRELVRAQTAAIGWNPDFTSPHAAGILGFAEENDLDPKWLAGKVGQAMNEVISDRHSDARADEATTAEGWYKAGIRFLGRDHHSDGPFLSSARNAFSMAEQAALSEEEGNADINPKVRDAMFYKFLVENFAGALKEIVHDDYWDNY